VWRYGLPEVIEVHDDCWWVQGPELHYLITMDAYSIIGRLQCKQCGHITNWGKMLTEGSDEERHQRLTAIKALKPTSPTCSKVTH
jgi:hypothetical protein